MLFKDPRLPIYKAHFPTPISEKKLQIIVPRKPVDGVLVPLSFQEFQEIEKRKKEISKEFKAWSAANKKKQQQLATDKEMLKKFMVEGTKENVDANIGNQTS